MSLVHLYSEKNDFTGVTEHNYYDPDTDTLTQHFEEDLTDFADITAASRNLLDARQPWKGDTHLVARIPGVLYYQLKEQGIIDDHDRLKKWLNDPDNKLFRTREGRV